MNLEARLTRLEATRTDRMPICDLSEERRAELDAIASAFDDPDGTLSPEGERSIAELRAFIAETAGAWR